MPDLIETSCPYCGEPIELVADASAGSAEYVEDCPVCCRPMRVTLTVDGDTTTLTTRTGDE